MDTNDNPPDGSEEARRLEIVLKGKLRIKIADAEVGHVEIPEGVPATDIAKHLRFEFKTPEPDGET